MAKVFVVGSRGIPDMEGGAEKSTERVFPLVAARGYDVTVAGLPQYLNGDTYKGVKLWRAPNSNMLKTDKLAYFAAAVWYAARNKPDIVHMTTLSAAVMVWAFRLVGCKTVVRFGSTDYQYPKWGWLGKFGFWLGMQQLRISNATLAVTTSYRMLLAEKGIRRNVFVIKNALDATDGDRALPESFPVKGPYVLTVCRITSVKNLIRLVEAFKIAAAGKPELSLALVGGLDDAEYVEELRGHLTPQTVLAGRIANSQLGPIYSNAHVFVNSSLYEGSSNAVLEAISWGVPTVLSSIPGNVDVGLPQNHYFPFDDVDAMAAVLRRAIENPAAVRVDPSTFQTWDQVADKTVAMYEAIGVPPSRTGPHIALAAAAPPSPGL